MLLVNRTAEHAETLRAEIEKEGGTCSVCCADVTREADVQRMVATDIERYGKIDVLHNNVGIGGPGTVVTVSEELGQGRDRQPQERHGVLQALFRREGGLVGLILSMAADSALRGIRVNLLTVGLVHTPRMAKFGQEARQRRRQAVPLKTEGTAWDVAWGAAYLASDESRWVTGAQIPVDRGELALREFPT